MAHVGAGDQIDLILEIDPLPRVTPMPKSFTQALERNKEAKAIFEKLPPSRQREILTYLNYLKKPETIERNIKKVLAALKKKIPN